MRPHRVTASPSYEAPNEGVEFECMELAECSWRLFIADNASQDANAAALDQAFKHRVFGNSLDVTLSPAPTS